jgi:hypothetical protein
MESEHDCNFSLAQAYNLVPRFLLRSFFFERFTKAFLWNVTCYRKTKTKNEKNLIVLEKKTATANVIRDSWFRQKCDKLIFLKQSPTTINIFF